MTRNTQNGLARYVGEFAQYHGWIFRCVSLYEHKGQMAWKVDPAPEHPYIEGGTVRGIADAALEPIGDPGEHEVDQMVALMRRKHGNAQRASS